MTTETDQLEFCAAHLQPLTAALTAFTSDRYLGEELAQEALVRAVERWDRVGRLRSPSAWLYRIGVNAARSRWRRLAAERRARARHGADDVHRDPDSAAVVAVRRALADLPERQRAALVLRYCAGLSIEETAAVLRVSEGAVRGLTQRGVSALRRTFDTPIGRTT